MNGPQLFTAQQIAAALGERANETRRLLDPAKARRMTVRGQACNAWPFAALSSLLIERLAKRAKSLGYRSAQHFLSDPGERWEPSIPLSRLDESCITNAERRRRVLEPLLPDA